MDSQNELVARYGQQVKEGTLSRGRAIYNLNDTGIEMDEAIRLIDEWLENN